MAKNTWRLSQVTKSDALRHRRRSSRKRQAPAWTPEVRDEVMQPEKTFRFDDCMNAQVFTNRVGELAEAGVHHPKLTTEWGRVLVTWWTHKIKGLHRNDFVVAAKTNWR